jgi:hypothetical protein
MQNAENAEFEFVHFEWFRQEKLEGILITEPIINENAIIS